MTRPKSEIVRQLVEMVEDELPVNEKDKANAEYLSSREMAFMWAREGKQDETMVEIRYAQNCRT